MVMRVLWIEVRIFVYETAGFRWVLVLPHRFSRFTKLSLIYLSVKPDII
jgi:hypothetical protein